MHFSPVFFAYDEQEVISMAINNLNNFPGTISNLPDKPNLSGADMKAKFEADCKALWEKMKEVIPVLNGKQDGLTITNNISSTATDNSVPTSKAVYDAIASAVTGAEIALPLSVANGGTGATTATKALENLGIYVGSTAPESIKDSLPTGAIYIYFEA